MGQNIYRRLATVLLLVIAILVIAPVALVAQSPPNDATPWWSPIVTPIALAITAYVSKFLFDGLKQLLPVLDNQSTLVKTVVSTLFTALMGFLAAHLTLGIVLPGDVHGVGEDTIVGILNALVAAGIYRLEHNKMAAHQGLPTKEQQIDGISGPAVAAQRTRLQ